MYARYREITLLTRSSTSTLTGEGQDEGDDEVKGQGQNKNDVGLDVPPDDETTGDSWKLILDKAKKVMDELKSLEAYNNQETNQGMYKLLDLYSTNYESRDSKAKIADTLVQEGFPDVAMRILLFFEAQGLFRVESFTGVGILTPLIICYLTAINCQNWADSSVAFSKVLAEKGFIPMLNKFVKHQLFQDEINNVDIVNIITNTARSEYNELKMLVELMNTVIGTLHNISKLPELKGDFIEAGVKESLQTYIKSEDDNLRIIATLCLANILDESESVGFEDNSCIPHLVTYVEKALNDPTRRCLGFTPEEIVSGLANLAVNDNNKIKIVESGAAQLLVRLLEHTDPDEQYEAARTICALSFSEEVKDKLEQEPGLVAALEKLTSNSTYKRVRHEVNRALWVIQEKADDVRQQSEEGEIKNHVFISYSHAHQKEIIQIKDRLKADGYRVWVDVDQMGGSTLEAMASAIEEAAVVLVCMSDMYKNSNSCRIEAEYTHQKKKDIVPLMMQRGYKPNGWLGLLIGAKFYINFDGKFTFNEAYNKLIQALADRGKDTRLVKKVAIDVVDAAPRRSRPKVAYRDWSVTQVQAWLRKLGLEGHDDDFDGYDGKLIYKFNQIRKETPEFCYKSLESKMNFNLKEILIFLTGLDELDQSS